MNPELLLIAVLVGIHLGEGIHVLPQGAWFFRRRLGGTWHAAPAARFPLLRGIHLALGGLLPRQICLSAQAEPFLASPSGVSSQHPGLPGSAVPSGSSFPWEEIHGLVRDETRLRLGDEVVGRAVDIGTAARWRKCLKAIAALPSTDRDRALRQAFRSALDVREAQRRWRKFRLVSAPLQWAAWVQFGLLFVVFPALLFTGRLALHWPPMVAALVLNHVSLFLRYTSYRRRIHPDGQRGHLPLLISMFLSPPYLVRIPEMLAMDLFEGLHPLAVGHVLLDRQTFSHMAGRFVRSFHHPPADLNPEIERSGLGIQREELDQWLQTLGIPPRELLEPPPRQGGAMAFCPRCHATFIRTEGTCSECPRVALKPYPAPGGSDPARSKN